MTAKLTLVATKPTSPVAEANEAPAYGEYDSKTIKDYVAKLHEGRYFRLYNAKSPHPRIISGNAPNEELPIAWLCADLATYCKEVGRRIPKPMPSHDYIAFGLESVTGHRFIPNGAALIQPRQSRHRYVNTYKAFESEHCPIALSEHFHGFFECWFPDTQERHHFLQYIGHMLQRPEERPSWHFMILSETGTGKGFLYKAILNPLLCKQTQQLKKFSELTGRFSNAMSGTLLIVLDDCKAKRTDQQDQLKSLMTEERVLLEEKGLAAGMVSTFSRFMFFTNEDVPLDLDDSERRWCIPKRLIYSHGLTGEEGRKERQQNVIQPLADWLKQPGALEAVYKYFMNYDLSDFNPNSPPMTETLREQIAKSVTPDQVFAFDFLSNNEMKVVKAEELSKAFTDAGLSKPGNQALGKLFAYCQYRSEALTVDKQKLRWWYPIAMSKAEAEAILAREKAERAEQPPY